MIRPWILMYHSVREYSHDPYLITVRPARFEAQMAWLRRRGLRGVGVGELLEARRHGRARGLVGLTFDDGYRDFVDEVVPVLARYGFGATVYVVAGLLGQHNRWDADAEDMPLMSVDQVREAARAGMEIGAHSVTHVRLTEVDDLVAQVDDSRRILGEIVDAPVGGFCYPYGDHDDAVVAAVRSAGFDHACAVGHPPAPGRFALPRSYVGDGDGPARLEAKLLRHRLHEAKGARQGTDDHDRRRLLT